MELTTAPIVFLSLISLRILVSLLSRKSASTYSKRRRPPGPRCLPFIGSLHHLLTPHPQVALRDLAKKHGPVMYLRLARLLVSCANGITGKATFGDECDAELQEQFLSAVAVALEFSGGFCVGDLFPSLWFIDNLTGLKHRFRRAHRQLDAVFDEIISKCEKRREEKKTATGAREDDLLSVMLRIKDEGELEFPIGMTNIKAIILDLFTAGTDTTSSAAEWAMTELIKNPKVMEKAQAEVQTTLDNKSPENHDGLLGELTYTRMVIKETLRLHPPVPLLLPRICRETCDVAGLEVAEGSRVMVNAWAIGRSPEYWLDAEEFRPERFKDSTADYNGTQFEYLPFGSGRRMCPGMNFGLAGLELIVAQLLNYFDWSLLAGIRPDDLDMDMIVGATARRKNQLCLVASPYKVPMEIQS
ncbi:LOW QUALITY PROTEIN: cytochrome P450 99A2-like [Brachypodium distachyon]|uniref:LOW QUALITY PROTEIN: cytochrome P450 99A2-like n=1 Tax=Brachypodium distachyon TaxID=15368 RepID=UPI000234F29C|nr:LOW QUALITY PROTEIN: cytochrome P450 99A2-like [Brachypodium distachyon]|eukprot:XP_024312128.1 LOW QUALITY PROTEIN: cytochrome P450 99A2-like [Brachypodium distachyon]